MTETQQQRWASLALTTLEDGGTHGLLPSGQVEMARALIKLIGEVRNLEHRFGTAPPG